MEALVVAAVLAAVIRFFIFQPFYIPSGSMEPNLVPGDRIIVNKFIYRFKEPARGDVMVFRFPKDPERDFIKRVIGLPGDTVEIRNSELYINNSKVKEPYLPKGLRFPDFGPYTVPQDAYFMMGDNRNNSEDSRFWGEMPKQNIRGKAVLVYWPVKRISLVKDLQDYLK
ncbi:MAG: signal peptidase I [Firmicutes bacterium]|nr:signal peptidase I [Bacillota bacterium]